MFLGGFPWFFKKTKEKKDRVLDIFNTFGDTFRHFFVIVQSQIKAITKIES